MENLDVLNKKWEISGHIGGLLCESEPGKICTKERYDCARDEAAVLVAEEAPDVDAAARFLASGNAQPPPAPYVAFHIDGTNRFLTLNPYGEGAQADTLALLSSCEFPIPPELLPNVVNYLVEPLAGASFEGAGFNYAAMTAEEGSGNDGRTPGLLQSFRVFGTDLSNVHFESVFGKYWRSQHWDHTISQADHTHRDETWTLTEKPVVVVASRAVHKNILKSKGPRWRSWLTKRK